MAILAVRSTWEGASPAAIWEWLDANHIPGLRCGPLLLIDTTSRVIMWHQLAAPAASEAGVDNGRKIWPSISAHHLDRHGLKLPEEDTSWSAINSWSKRSGSQLGVLRCTPLITDPPAGLFKEAV